MNYPVLGMLMLQPHHKKSSYVRLAVSILHKGHQFSHTGMQPEGSAATLPSSAQHWPG
jgi:hypothetical protein